MCFHHVSSIPFCFCKNFMRLNSFHDEDDENRMGYCYHYIEFQCPLSQDSKKVTHNQLRHMPTTSFFLCVETFEKSAFEDKISKHVPLDYIGNKLEHFEVSHWAVLNSINAEELQVSFFCYFILY